VAVLDDMSNEAFQLLSRGGVSLDKSRSEASLFRFNVRPPCYVLDFSSDQSHEKQTNAINHNPTSIVVASELPVELDFFKYAQNITGKRKRMTQAEENQITQRRRKGEDCEHAEWHNDHDSTQDSLPTAHRVKTKGTNIPTNITSFEELRKYSIPAHLYANLASGGYKSPTGIQSHCIPILLEVSFCNNAHARIMIFLG
jgi:ATP-dependent RNA helicase DDX52/ROK1